MARSPCSVVSTFVPDGARVGQQRQPFGILHRQRPQHHCIDHCENRGVRADAKRQRQYRDQ